MKSTSVTLIVLLLFAACQKDQPVSYQKEIQPILDRHCVSCHSGQRPKGKIDLTSYTNLMTTRAKVSGKQPLIVPGSPTESRLYVLCATSQAHFRMPPDTSQVTPLPTEELKVMMRWITQGAKDN